MVGRIPSYITKESLAKPVATQETELKHKRPEKASTSSQTSPEFKKIKADDLAAEKPSEVYWEVLAEQRRLALEETLEENEELHQKVESLQAELNESRRLLEEAQSLVEVFTEMLEAKEENDVNEAAEVTIGEEARENDEIQAEIDANYAAVMTETEDQPKKD